MKIGKSRANAIPDCYKKSPNARKKSNRTTIRSFEEDQLLMDMASVDDPRKPPTHSWMWHLGMSLLMLLYLFVARIKNK
jgi:hypothetical protein